MGRNGLTAMQSPCNIVLLLLCAAQIALSQFPAADRVARFGIITDVHYADYDTAGTRFYRDSLPKVEKATKDIIEADADFMIELGDFKDTLCPGPNGGNVSLACTAKTLDFLDTIEGAMSVFAKPKFHVLGNHDVDILNQSAVLAHIHNYGMSHAEGHYSFSVPFPPNATTNDTKGCLITDSKDVWIVHQDGSRNWLSKPAAGCTAKAAPQPAAIISAIPKRHGATSPLYTLNQAQSAQACRNSGCVELPTPAPGAPLKFITLNGDFNSNDQPWFDLDGSPQLPFAWDEAWVSNTQLEWLTEELAAAQNAAQKVIVFVHYRLDGGVGGPVNCSATTECGKKHNRAWVDDCTLKNAAVVRAILEESGVVLATFSGHDHVPYPAYSTSNNVLYFTHAGLVEGSIKNSNAYSVVDVLGDCSVVVKGYANASSVVHQGPLGCRVGK